MALAKITRFLIKLTHNVFYMCAAAAMYFLDLSFQLVRLANYLANKNNLSFVEKNLVLWPLFNFTIFDFPKPAKVHPYQTKKLFNRMTSFVFHKIDISSHSDQKTKTDITNQKKLKMAS